MLRTQNHLFSKFSSISAFSNLLENFLGSVAIMTVDYVKQITQENPAKVHIKDPDRVNQLIQEIINGGSGKLQVVSDFDRTITKQHEEGKIHQSSFGIFAKCPSLPQSYLVREKELTDKYLPIEIDPNIPLEEKKIFMEEWWSLSEKILDGINISEKELDDVVSSVSISLRDDAVKSFNLLEKYKIPVLVFSAGIGDVVLAVLKHFKVLLPNVKVVSNFLKRNEDGVIKGFSGEKMIHVFNKNEQVLQGTPYYEMISNRCNVILMGDSIGDAGMANGLPNCNAVLKIGFLYDHVAGHLPNYKEHFDIILEDDQTMNVLNAILELLEQ